MKRPAPVAAVSGALRAVGAFARAVRADGSVSGRSFALTLLTPIRLGAEAELAAHLDGLGVRRQSPLARLPFVHFGRWVVIDQLKANYANAPVPAPRLKSQYLLFTTCVTAPAGDGTSGGKRATAKLPQSFLEEVWQAIPDEADAIWRHCLGYPGVADKAAFVGYLARSQVKTSLFHVGYPDATVDEVRRAIATREHLVAFAQAHQGAPAETLQRAYREQSPTWPL